MSCKKSIYLIFLLLAVLCSCNKGIDEKAEALTHASTFSTDLSVPTSLNVVDGYLIASDLFGGDGMVIIYDKKGNVLSRIARKGESGTEALEVSNVEVYKEGKTTLLNVYDLEKGKILVYDFSALTKKEKELPKSKNIVSENRYYGMSKIEKGYAAIGMFDNHKFDLLNDSLEKNSEYGEYLPNKSKVVNVMVHAAANFGKSVVSPNRKLLVNVVYAAGVLRFYEVKGNKIALKKDVVIKPLNYKVIGDDYKNLEGVGFLTVAISDKYVYALYSGEKENPKSPVPTASYVYKYDYDGNIKHIYKLDKPTVSLAVDAMDKNLYTIADDKGYNIYTYEI